MNGRDQRRRVQEFVRTRLREETAARGGAAGIARAAGIAKATISDLISDTPKRDPGFDVMHQLADYWEMTYGQLEAAALGLAPPSAAPLPVDPNDVYPNRARALALAELAGASAEARSDIRRSVLVRGGDRPVKWWLLRTLAKDADADDLRVTMPIGPQGEVQEAAAVRSIERAKDLFIEGARQSAPRLAKRPKSDQEQ